MFYGKKFKLDLVRNSKSGKSSISEIARIKQIPKQTLARWIRLYKLFGEEGLENKKAGAKVIPINQKFEILVLNMWKKRKRSVYRMRKDLKKDSKRNGFNISERQIRKIYKKNRLQISSDTPKKIQM